jgi:hypothetical protein
VPGDPSIRQKFYLNKSLGECLFSAHQQPCEDNPQSSESLPSPSEASLSCVFANHQSGKPVAASRGVPSEAKSIMSSEAPPVMSSEASFVVPSEAHSVAPTEVPSFLHSVALIEVNAPSEGPAPSVAPSGTAAYEQVTRHPLRALINQMTTAYQTTANWSDFMKQCRDYRGDLHPYVRPAPPSRPHAQPTTSTRTHGWYEDSSLDPAEKAGCPETEIAPIVHVAQKVLVRGVCRSHSERAVGPATCRPHYS